MPTVQDHLDLLRDLNGQLATLKQRIALAERALIELLPFGVGSTVTNLYGEQVFVEHVSVRPDFGRAGARTEDCWIDFHGKRIKKDGTPHATANAYGWLRLDDILAHDTDADKA